MFIEVRATVGWSTTQLPSGYDQSGYGEQNGEGIKTRLIVLVSAVRTLLRGGYQFSESQQKSTTDTFL